MFSLPSIMNRTSVFCIAVFSRAFHEMECTCWFAGKGFGLFFLFFLGSFSFPFDVTTN